MISSSRCPARSTARYGPSSAPRSRKAGRSCWPLNLRYAALECTADDFALSLACELAAEVLPKAERDGRQLEATPASASGLHACVPVIAHLCTSANCLASTPIRSWQWTSSWWIRLADPALRALLDRGRQPSRPPRRLHLQPEPGMGRPAGAEPGGCRTLGWVSGSWSVIATPSSAPPSTRSSRARMWRSSDPTGAPVEIHLRNGLWGQPGASASITYWFSAAGTLSGYYWSSSSTITRLGRTKGSGSGRPADRPM